MSTRTSAPPPARSPAAPPGLRAALFFVVAATTLLALYFNRPPAPKPATAPASEFSAERAIEHLRVIAKVPHPTGSPALAEVREYITKELRARGLEPEVQSTAVSVSQMGRPIPGGMIHNIVATLRGTGEGPSLLLASHYDSVPAAPGASDDGAAVAAMLETLRALKTEPPLKNDVIFLFTDAEELGLAGAQAFAEGHPAAARVGVLLNFEARGSHGPVFMFETSEENGWLIEQLAASGAPVAAGSLSAAVYQLMPNFTDFTELKRHRMRGLGFAYIGGLRNYHTPDDTVENLDPGSLQHHGEYMLALARRLGGADLGETRGRDAVFFTVLGSVFVHYSSAWAAPLLALSAGLFGLVLARGVRAGKIRAGRVAAGLAALLGSLVAAFVAALVAWLVVRALDGRYVSELKRHVLDDGVYMAGFTALSIGAASGVFVVARRWAWARTAELFAGCLAGWVLFSLASVVAMPGASYLVTWPILFGAAGLFALVLAPEGELAGLREGAIAAAGAVPTILLIAPTVVAVFWAFSLAASPGVAVFIALLVGLLEPVIAAISGPKRALVPAASAALGVFILVLRAITSG